MSSSSGLGPPGADTSSARPRNRRPNVTSSTSSASESASEETSLYGSSRFQTDTGGRGGSSRSASGTRVAGLLSPTVSTWVPTWSAIQDFATTLLASDGSASGNWKTRKADATWGPAPPDEVAASSRTAASARPQLQDVAAGQTAAREAELKARKTARVLESHPGVNGGLDVRGNFKRRSSDENLRASASEPGAGAEDFLVYVHRVTDTDTYFGIILKYRCREDAFRRANGLWSRDNIQIRKWVVLPVESCEIRGSPCDDPSLLPQGVDLLAQTPRGQHQQQSGLDGRGSGGGGYFDTSTSGTAAGLGSTVVRSTTGESLTGEPPWTHVRWVRLESCPDPVEIVRMSRNALGYFPPRRKKSIHSSVSTLSTPRASLDGLASTSLPDRTVSDSPLRSGSRHPSFLGSSASRAAALGTSSLSSSPSRYLGGTGASKAAAGAVDPRPEWMRRPGGVGSMSKNVRAPGPARDPLNKWTKKHLPGLNIESMPSMSVLGSETAHFGFGDESVNIVESAAGDGRDAALLAPKDTSLDKAAAAIETWMRGAFTKGSNTPSQAAAAGSVPSSSFAERIGRRLEETLGDLIELEDGPGDNRLRNSTSRSSLAGTSRATSASGWHGESEGSSHGRNVASKGKKAD